MSKPFIHYFLALFMIAASQAALFGITGHVEAVADQKCLAPRYRLVDLGPADLSAKELTKLELVFSLAPSINNLGQIAFNTAQGAFIRDPSFGEYALQLNDTKIFVHDLNNNGEMLASINRTGRETEWVLWPRRSLYGAAWSECDVNAKKFHIGSLENPEAPLFMGSVNDMPQAVGYKREGESLIPLTWNRKEGLLPMGKSLGYNVLGFPRASNNRGTIAGYFQEANDSPPFVWNPCKGINILRNYRDLVDCHGWIDLADLVLTEDNVVYGSYVVRFVSKIKGNDQDVGVYFTYRWDPVREDFNVLALRNFRIAAVNSANTLAGSSNGRAAIRRQGNDVLELREMVPHDIEGWELLEATGINDRDQFVGYGNKMGKMHNFLIEPLP